MKLDLPSFPSFFSIRASFNQTWCDDRPLAVWFRLLLWFHLVSHLQFQSEYMVALIRSFQTSKTDHLDLFLLSRLMRVYS